MKKHWIILSMALLVSAGALAQVTVTAPWVRATVAQAKASGAFMQLTAKQDMRLVEVRSSVAGSVLIHQMEMSGTMMKMHAVAGIDLVAGKPLDLAAGGYHIMLLDLKRQLKEGESVPLTLVVRDAGGKLDTIDVMAPVKALTYVAPAGEHSH